MHMSECWMWKLAVLVYLFFLLISFEATLYKLLKCEHLFYLFCVHSCEPAFYQNSILCVTSSTPKQAEQDICTEIADIIPNELALSKKLIFWGPKLPVFWAAAKKEIETWKAVVCRLLLKKPGCWNISRTGRSCTSKLNPNSKLPLSKYMSRSPGRKPLSTGL